MFDFEGVSTRWYWIALAIIAVVAVFALVGVIVTMLQKKRGISGKLETRDLAYGSICIAISFSLSFLGITLPNGGTVTAFSTVPIIIYCYYFGFKKGLVVCIVNMLLQLLQNPYIVHPFSAVLDYMLPYMFLSVVGVFAYFPRQTPTKNPLKNHWLLYIGCSIYIILRYISHVLSGIIFYAEWAWDGYTLLGYSLAYNSFVLLDFAIAMVAVVSITTSNAFSRFMSGRRMMVQKTES